MDPIDCIEVVVALDPDTQNYVGTFTTPDSGSFADTVSCNVLVEPPVPTGDYTPSCSSSFFSFSNIQADQPACIVGDTRRPRAIPVSWTTFSFQPSPTSWTSGQTITVTMTADG